MEDMDKVNEMLQPIIDNLQINQNETGTGYPASGTRNVCACIGNRVCPFGNYNTAAFAKRIEKAIFPNDLHFKIALTGCANDCIKARMHDFGIIGMTEPQYDPNRCVSLLVHALVGHFVTQTPHPTHFSSLRTIL